MIAAGILNATDFIDRFAALAPQAADALRREAGEIADDLREAADRNLSGAVLKQRTGTLRASLKGSVNETPDISILVSADAPYAAYQEYGFTGAESVRAHLRRQTRAFGRPVSAKDVAVRAFTRRVDYPAHSYLRSAVAEIAPSVQGRLAAALSEALQP
jgi:phage gpG-like protein